MWLANNDMSLRRSGQEFSPSNHTFIHTARRIGSPLHCEHTPRYAKNADAGRELLARLAPAAKIIPEFVYAHLQDLHSLKGTIESIQGRAGPVRVLVNNAANDERHEMEEVTPEFWRERLAINLDHYFFCIQSVAPAMEAAGGGSIVNLGSCVWRLGFPGLPACATAKAAIEGLTRGVARTLGPRNIRSIGLTFNIQPPIRALR